jgi:hypothetical protein
LQDSDLEYSAVVALLWPSRQSRFGPLLPDVGILLDTFVDNAALSDLTLLEVTCPNLGAFRPRLTAFAPGT